MSNVAQFPWGAIPRVAPSEARATRIAARLGGSRAARDLVRSLGRAFESSDLPAPGVGRSAVGLRPPDRPLGAEMATPVLLERVVVGSQALVLIDHSLATSVIGDLLKVSVSSIDDWMFGALAFIVARTIEGAREDVPCLRQWRVDLSRAPIEIVAERLTGPGPLVELGLELAYGGERGWVRLLCRGAALEASPAGGIADEQIDAFAGLSGRYPVAVGRVRLSREEVSSLAPGDAIFFDEHAVPCAGGEPQSSRLVLSRGFFVTGEVNIERPSWRIALGDERPFLKEEAKMESNYATDETTQLLRAADVTVEAIVGRVELTLDEVARLAPGQILETSSLVGEPVELIANGRSLGRGELVDVQGRVGVRILAVG